jgi:hypothetical protein
MQSLTIISIKNEERLSMLKKLFGGKKEQFFAQIDESQLATVEAPDQAEVKPEPVVVVEEPVVIAAETVVAETPAPKAKKTPVKKSKAAKTAKTTVAPTPAPAPVAKAPAPVDPKEVAFASQYLITQTLSRRLPGPSLNKYKDIARQVTKR